VKIASEHVNLHEIIAVLCMFCEGKGVALHAEKDPVAKGNDTLKAYICVLIIGLYENN
jgi:hypothetical protein